jgi:hypothetical protein
VAFGSRLGQTESLEKIWEWAEVELSTEDLNNKLFLDKDDRKKTVWHYASLWDNVELLGGPAGKWPLSMETALLEKLWEWGKTEPYFQR